MFYQGPVINPAVELNIAVGGRTLVDPRRNLDAILGEVIDLYYRPRDAGTGKRLAGIFSGCEDAYFGQWDQRGFAAKGRSMPGELHLTDLFGTSPGAATYLLEPFLDAAGRREYKQRLLSILPELDQVWN
jgi:hypothetical protein